jgi:hypothetical protein
MTGRVRIGHARAGVAHSRWQVHDHVHALGAKGHRWVLGESGLWSLGCDCAAF